jgi:PAS domain S-box-containing protein
VFEEGPLGVVLLGLDGRIQHANRRFCEMLGYSEEKIIALGSVGLSHPEDWKKDRQLASRLLHGEIPNYTIDKRYARKDGTVFWGQVTVSLMHDAEGKPTAFIRMIEDITERKRTQTELQL